MAKVEIVQGKEKPSFTECAVFIHHLTSERRLSFYTARNYQHSIEFFYSWICELEKKKMKDSNGQSNTKRNNNKKS